MAKACGQLVISLDLELEVQRGSWARERQLGFVTTELLALLDRHSMSATFAVADPVRSAATEAILASRQRHEIAVLGDATWMGPGAGRERLGRELERRFGSARAAGLAVTTLALRRVTFDQHHDLLAKNDVRAVRSDPDSVPSAENAAISLRHGVWEAPATLRLPTTAPWWFAGKSAAAKAVENAARRRQTTHLVIDAAELIDHEAAGFNALAQALSVAGQWRERGELAIENVQSLLSAQTQSRGGRPLRSILQVA